MTESGKRNNGRIVVGVDGSANSTQALRWALAQAVRTGAEVDAVACWHWPATAIGFPPYAELISGMAQATQETAEGAVATAVAAVDGAAAVGVRTRVVEGYPAKVLIESAADADLLVVGSRGHGELSGVLLGSVGLHCASHSPCPVLIVRG